jgi:hypothetical protein
MRRFLILVLATAVLVSVAVLVPQTRVAAQNTNPPPSFVDFVPLCYDQVNGAARVVKPWGVKGASIPNCTPPAAWQISGTSYDPTMCNTGGSFDCRTSEFYIQLALH